MSDLLYIEGSPRGERSYSVSIARAFLEAYHEAHPDDEIKELNVFRERLPAIDGDAINTKYAILHGKTPTVQERNAWRPVEDLIDEFKSADKYVFSVPMWNFGIPYRLKNYIDVLVQPTYTFTYTPEDGYKGLVTGKPVFIAYARGGAYGADSGFETLDYQKRYLECILNFIGLTDIRSIVFEDTLTRSRDELEARKAAAMNEARAMAKEFWSKAEEPLLKIER